jgi:hypothetical protein
VLSVFDQLRIQGETNMKKASKVLLLTVLLSISLGFAVAQAADLTVNDGYVTYDCYFAATISAGLGTGPISLYGVVIRGTSTIGWLTYQPSWSAFKIIILEDYSYWGYTFEGHWSGNGSAAYGGNNNGALSTRYINAGSLKPGQQAPGAGPDPMKK